MSHRTVETDPNSLSIKDLVQKRFDKTDPWRLAVVQRDALWNPLQMAQLLDSLLAGYPIGSLLLCQVREETYALNTAEGERRPEKVNSQAWQLLDGQQRINALVTLFNGDSEFGQFLMDLTVIPDREDVVTKRKTKQKMIKYIKFIDILDQSKTIDNRNKYINLSNWYNWINEKTPDELQMLSSLAKDDPKNVLLTINNIDSEFCEPFNLKEIENAGHNFDKLLNIWMNAKIPIQRLELNSANDVLQVFSRINLEGVAVSGEDIFFAGIKTIWHGAEGSLNRVMNSLEKIIDRMSALRILARLSNMYLDGNDLLPLKIDRLAKNKGAGLVRTIEWLASHNHVALERMKLVAKWLSEKSQIGHGLRVINPRLFDHVFAWAAVNPELLNKPQSEHWLPPIENFLVGAQSFRWAAKFRDEFSRSVFKISVSEGSNGKAFPLEAIVYDTFLKWPNNSTRTKSAIQFNSDEELRNLADDNLRLFLSIVQKIPWNCLDSEGKQRRVEWDHIYPQALSKHMRIPSIANQRRSKKNHDLRELVFKSGNIWALARELNQIASDMWPSEKFEMLKMKAGKDNIPSRWPSETKELMNPQELKDLLAAEIHIRKSLENAEEKVKINELEAGMLKFQSFVNARRLRLYTEVVGKFKDLPLFATKKRDDESYLNDLSEMRPLSEVLGVRESPSVN